MGLEFLHQYCGQRLRPDPALLNLPREDDSPLVDEEPVDLDLELPREKWKPLDSLQATGTEHLLPIRFVDGCHRGQTVAWVQDIEGHPVPVMLAEVGGVCMRGQGCGRTRSLQRECVVVERVVTMVIDPFPWHEVESFAIALKEFGFRLLPVQPLRDEHDRPFLSYDFELMRRRTQNRSNYEMEVLEEVALAQDPHTPTLADGRLHPRMHGLSPSIPVVGVIKTHREDYLHEAGWQTFYRLQPGQRTPAFGIPQKALPVVSWYLRLGTGEDADSPAWGIVRIEITAAFFQTLSDPFAYIHALSAWLIQVRSRQADYGRSPISLEPIVRAEASLNSLLSPPDYLKAWFYRHTGI